MNQKEILIRLKSQRDTLDRAIKSLEDAIKIKKPVAPVAKAAVKTKEIPTPVKKAK